MSTQEQQQAAVPSAETQQGESHPFSRSWTVWHDPPISKKQKTKHWENRLNKVGSFQTIEEFWGYIFTVAILFIYIFIYCLLTLIVMNIVLSPSTICVSFIVKNCKVLKTEKSCKQKISYLSLRYFLSVVVVVLFCL